MLKKIKIGLIVLPWVVILILALALIFHKKTIVQYLGDPDKDLKDSLALLDFKTNALEEEIGKRDMMIDSLSHLDKEIIYRNHEEIHYIYSTATAQQLDSIIRASIRKRKGY